MSVMKMFDLSGKVAVITGAGNGLGYQFAEAMAEAGADVVCADIDTVRNEATAARVVSFGRKALSIPCEVTRGADKAFGRVDIAFANAGMADPVAPPLHDTPSDNWNAVIAVKGAVVNLTRELALEYAAITAFTPMRRVADASEIKGTALYLSSNASSFTTAWMLVTDGDCMAK